MGWFQRTPIRSDLSLISRTSSEGLGIGFAGGAGLVKKVSDVFVGEIGLESGYTDNVRGKDFSTLPITAKLGFGLYNINANMALIEMIGGVDAINGNGIWGLGLGVRLSMESYKIRQPFILPFWGANLRYNWNNGHEFLLQISLGAFFKPNI